MKNEKKGFLIPVVALIVAVIAVGAGVGYFKNKEEKISTSDQVSSEQKDRTENIDLSDWKVYRSDIYGFEFKYPPNWQYRVFVGASYDYGDTIQLFSPESYEIAQKGDRDGVSNFMSFNMWQHDSYVKGVVGKDVVVSGKNAVDTGWVTPGVGVGLTRQVVFSNDPFMMVVLNAVGKTQQIEEKILSTFKFIK